MTNSYLLDIIKHLSASDRDEIMHLLQSPSHTKEWMAKEVLRLYQTLLEAAPEFEADRLNKEFVFARVFPGQEIVQGKLEKVMSELNKRVRRYLLAQRYLSESMDTQLQSDWIGWLVKQGFSERARQALLQLQNQQKESRLESLPHLRSKLNTDEQKHDWALTENQFISDLNIPALIHSLDLYYHNYRLELENKYLLLQKVTNLTSIPHNEEAYRTYLTSSSLLTVSHKVNTLLNKSLPLKIDFDDLFGTLKHFEDTFPSDVLAGFYYYLRNLCTLLINDGHVEYIDILHQINIDNLEKGYLLSDNKLVTGTYLNIVQIAIRAKDWKWALYCTERFKNYIVGGDPDGLYYNMNKAHCLFAMGDYQGALDVLPEVPSNNHWHHMLRRLELKAYFELKSELLFHKLDAFRKYIERTAHKSLSRELQEMDSNFIYILLTLAQSPEKDKAKSKVLIKRIEGKKRIAERNWLLEKAKALA